MPPSPIQPASTGKRLLSVAGLLTILALGALWAFSKSAEVGRISFAEAAAPLALRLAGLGVLFALAGWWVTGAVRGATASVVRKRLATIVCLFHVAIWSLNGWVNFHEEMGAAEIALRVAPFVAWALLVSAALDLAARRFGLQTAAPPGAPPSAVRALTAGVGFAVWMATVIFPTMTAFLTLDARRGLLDSYAHTLGRVGDGAVQMLPFLIMSAGLMALTFWGSPRFGAWSTARQKRTDAA